jgi:predicted Zn-dependent peptidase
MLMDCQIENRIEHAKQVVVSEYWGLYSSETERELLDQIQQLLFRGHPQLETFHGNLGHPEEFMACTPKELQAFYDRYYTPSNMSALFVGDIRFEELIEMLEQSPFGQSKPGQRNIPVQIPFQVPVPEKNELRFIGESSIQSIRCLFECVIPYTIAPTTLHLVIFEEMLRDYLLDELRLSTENPLTYEVTVGSYFWQDCQELYITLEVMSEEAIAFIKKAIAQPWVTRERFTEAKEGLLKEYFMPDWSYQQVFGYCLENLLRYQRIRTFTQAVQIVEKIGFEDIKRLASHVSLENGLLSITYPTQS